MIMVKTIIHFLRTVSPWVFALAFLLCLLGAGFGSAYLLSKIERPRPFAKSHASLPEAAFLVSGQDPATSLEEGLSFLYFEDNDGKRIAQSIVQSFIQKALGDTISMESLRESFSNAPFLFLLRENEEGKLAWLFSSTVMNPSVLSQNLHHSFLADFPAVSIRTRTVPSGKIVEDVIFDDTALISTEERSYGYTIRRSTHVESGASFLTAEKNGEILLSNDRRFLMEILLADDLPQKSMFFAKPATVGWFAEVFPDSDLLRHAQRMLAQKEEVLSLSSFVCIP